jgi:O-antigen ligase
MNQTITTSILVAGAVLAALIAAFGMAGAVHVTAKRQTGYFHWAFYGIMFLVALTTLVMGRDMTTTVESFERVEVLNARHPLLVIAQPLLSLLVLTVSGERIISHWLKRDSKPHSYHLLFFSFVIFWVGTVAAPALFSAHPLLSHDFVYPLVIGMASVLVTPKERDKALTATRDALVVFMILSLLLVPIAPGMVMDSSYSQGLFAGVPRFGGLSPHAVSMGLLAQLGLLCLLAYPYERTWLNRLAWLCGLTALFLAQSKTAWIAFVLCSLCICIIKFGPPLWRRIGDPKNTLFGMLIVLMFIFAMVVAGGVIALSDLGGKLSGFLDTDQGAQLMSMTGRDQIWAIAYDEWQKNPVFGYGPGIFDIDFRIALNMPNATHAHNQFMDTLARSGTVGAVSLIFYSVVLLVLSIRYARQSNGLTLALFLGLVLRSISEVPLVLFGYGPELIAQVLLLIVIAGCAAEKTARSAQPNRSSPGPQTARPSVAARYRP